MSFDVFLARVFFTGVSLDVFSARMSFRRSLVVGVSFSESLQPAYHLEDLWPLHH